MEVGVVDVVVLRMTDAGLETLCLQRSEGTRCPGSWETVHGRIEPGESPDQAAVREVVEETGLEVARLYSLTVNPFFMKATRSVQLAVVFGAFVDGTLPVRLDAEHSAYEWIPLSTAPTRLFWPREHEAIRHVEILLGNGDAGVAEDVLRLR